MAFLPQAFLSNINTKSGLAKPCRFSVILPIPRYINEFISQSAIEQLLNFPGNLVQDITSILTGESQDEQSRSSNPAISRYLSLQCEATELPGKTLLTQEAKIYGPSFKVPYQTQYQDINLNFICTNQFYERKLFDRWMESIHPSDTNNLRFPKGETTRYMTNIKIIQYDDFIKQIYAIELIDAFPIGIASQQLSWSDDGFHRVGVQFAYQKYKVIYKGQTDLLAAALEIFGSKASQWVDRTTGQLLSPIGNLFGRL